MNRRHWFASAGSALAAAAQSLPRPAVAQQKWQDYEMGVVFQFDLPLFRTRWLEALQNRPSIPISIGPISSIPIISATHSNGFLQWQSVLYPYGLKQTIWRNGSADVLGDFVNSAAKAGLAPGVYLSWLRALPNGRVNPPAARPQDPRVSPGAPVNSWPQRRTTAAGPRRRRR